MNIGKQLRTSENSWEHRKTAENIGKLLRTSQNSWEHRKTSKIIWYHPKNNWGPIIDDLVQFEEDFNSRTEMWSGWLSQTRPIPRSPDGDKKRTEILPVWWKKLKISGQGRRFTNLTTFNTKIIPGFENVLVKAAVNLLQGHLGFTCKTATLSQYNFCDREVGASHQDHRWWKGLL